MAEALLTINDYIDEARVLQQDTVEEYRNAHAERLSYVNQGLQQMRRLRPDLFIGRTTPNFQALDEAEVALDELYRQTLLFYIVGMAQLRDEEDTTDARSAAFLNLFSSQLVGVLNG